VFIEHRGTKVYHAYKGERALTFWFTLSPAPGARQFDVRELPENFDFVVDRAAVLRAAIDSGSIRKAKMWQVED
jgi:hypothetical protein